MQKADVRCKMRDVRCQKLGSRAAGRTKSETRRQNGERPNMNLCNLRNLRMLFVPIVALLCLVCKTETPESKSVKDLVPASNVVTGWTRDGGLDTAATAAELTTLLDSVAQPYIANGFATFCRQFFAGTIAGSSVRIELRVADMADSAKAKAVFTAFADPSRTAWTGDNPGVEARIWHDSLTCEIDFRTDKFYVWLAADTSTFAVFDIAKVFALEVAHLADSTEPAPEQPRDVVILVPADNEIGGWTRSGAMQTAETPTQLEAIIDGEAIPYENNHFVKCAFQNFSGDIGGSAVELDLRIFDMGDTTNARNVYAEVAAGTEVPWTGDNPGVEARTDESFLFAYRVEFRDSRYYFRADIMDKSTAAQDVVKLFARNVAAAIRDTTD